jgi:hypothetical protein
MYEFATNDRRILVGERSDVGREAADVVVLAHVLRRLGLLSDDWPGRSRAAYGEGFNGLGPRPGERQNAEQDQAEAEGSDAKSQVHLTSVAGHEHYEGSV